jgi:acyl dehydratase
MALCHKVLVKRLADGDPDRLHRLKVRFAKPVLPGQTLSIAGWRLGGADGTENFGLEVSVTDAVVLKDGLVEIAKRENKTLS